MAMKIPTFKSQTKPGNEPANIQLGISANPSAMSQASVAQANFGNNLAKLGGQVFDMGTQLQKIKNDTKTKQLQNEYIKASEDIVARSLIIGQSGQDQSDWVKKEKLKLKNAMLNGQVYSLKNVGPSEGDPTLYNFNASTGKPNDIIKNKSVIKAFNSAVADRDLLDDVDIGKQEITAYLNNKLMEYQLEEDRLVTDAIMYSDTAKGQVALHQLFGYEGRDEIIGPDGIIMQDFKPSVDSITQRKMNDGLFENGIAGAVEDLQRLEEKVAEGTIDHLLNNANLLKDDPKAQRAIEDKLLEYSEFLFEEDGSGRYSNFANIPFEKRIALEKKIIDGWHDTLENRNDQEDRLYTRAKRARELNHQDHFKLVSQGILSGEEQYDLGYINKLVSEDSLKKDDAKFLKTMYNNTINNKDTVTDPQFTIEFSGKLETIYDPSDVAELKEFVISSYNDNEVSHTDLKTSLATLSGFLDETKTDYHKDVQRNLRLIKNMIAPGGDAMFSNISQNHREVLGTHINMFTEAVLEQNGAYPTKEEVNAIGRKVMENFKLLNAENLTGDDYNYDGNPLAFINPNIINEYNRMFATGGQLGVDENNQRIMGETLKIGNNQSILEAMADDPIGFKERMLLVHNNIKDPNKTPKRLFEQKLEQLDIASYVIKAQKW